MTLSQDRKIQSSVAQIETASPTNSASIERLKQRLTKSIENVPRSELPSIVKIVAKGIFDANRNDQGTIIQNPLAKKLDQLQPHLLCLVEDEGLREEIVLEAQFPSLTAKQQAVLVSIAFLFPERTRTELFDQSNITFVKAMADQIY